METSINKIKGWVKVLPFYLFALLPLLASCSEADDTVEEFANWQARNDTYFAQQYQAHLAASDASTFVLKKLSLPDSMTISQAGATNCVLVDVLERGEGGASPLYTDTARVHYRAWLIPSDSYPEGYQFDSSYNTDRFDPDLAQPVSFVFTNVVEGFALALQHMHRGDRWRVTIPYQMGYGVSDYGSIPAFSTLIFDMRLEDF